MYFEMTVEAEDGREMTLTSAPSEPFIICTNINQWVQSEKKLFKRVCFGEESQVSWVHFERELRQHFARALGTARTLSEEDVRFLHARLGGVDRVTQAHFSSFWDWYGAILKEIFEKTGHWRLLWERYVISGFMEMREARRLLESHLDGTFMLIFPETMPPQLAIPHVCNSRPDRCGLISLHPEHDREPIREFLEAQPALLHLLSPSVDRQPGRYSIVAKSRLLKDFRPTRRQDRSE
jgi:hypothetical protein